MLLIQKISRSKVVEYSSPKSSPSELLKQQEENHRKEIEREKMLREKYQRENEEMKNRLSKLTTTPSTLEVN
jgi:hypothetical protein